MTTWRTSWNVTRKEIFLGRDFLVNEELGSDFLLERYCEIYGNIRTARLVVRFELFSVLYIAWELHSLVRL